MKESENEFLSKDLIVLRLPIFRNFRKKTRLLLQPEKPDFSSFYKQPLAVYLFNRFLQSVHALDKAIFYNDVSLFKAISDSKTLRRVTRLMYNRYLSARNSPLYEGQSVFRNCDSRTTFSSVYTPIKLRLSQEELRLKHTRESERSFFEEFGETALLVGNVLGVYGKELSEVKRRIQHEEINHSVFDSVLQQVTKDLEQDLFPRFLNSFYYVYYLKFRELNVAVSFSDFIPLHVLGRGAFGVVRTCNKKDTGFKYAVKCISKKRLVAQKSLPSIFNERRVLESLSKSGSRFIVRLHYALFDKNQLYFVMDLMPGGDLKLHLNREEFFEEDRARFYAAEILLGLSHMHAQNVLYRDLKLENVLLSASGHCRLSDFGLSMQTRKPVRGYAGTPGYTAPEVVLNKFYNRTADFFSFGVLVYRLLSGKKPFDCSGSHGDLDRNVCRADPLFPKEIFSSTAKDLLVRLLEKEPSKRLGYLKGAAEIKEHEWFESIDFGLLENGYLDAPFKPNVEELEAQAAELNFKVNNDKYRHITVTEKFERLLAQEFYYAREESFQQEIVAALEIIDEESFCNGFKYSEKRWFDFGKKDSMHNSSEKEANEKDGKNIRSFGGAEENDSLANILPESKKADFYKAKRVMKDSNFKKNSNKTSSNFDQSKKNIKSKLFGLFKK